jgi:predicted dehydrogenase
MGPQPLRIAVLGAGHRGEIFGDLIARHPDLARVVAVAEPRAPYRQAFAARHGLDPADVFETWQELAASGRPYDAAVVATMDRDHLGPALAGLERGWDLLLEKPMAASLEDCVAIARVQRASNAIVAVCHSLRYHQGFRRVRDLVAAGAIGDVVTVDQLEQVAYYHFAHSYVRGNWGNLGRATPLLLAKSCHDLDYMAWLVDKPCLRVSSFGSLVHFTPANAPAGSAARCTEGCAAEATCAYSAIRQYVTTDRHAWPAMVAAADHSEAAHREAIERGPYGRCVYRADNDVVDHQVAILEFEGGATATLTVTAFTQEQGRRVRVHGTRGELAFDEARITIKTYADGATTVYDLPEEAGPHGGGDARVVAAWLEALHRRDPAVVTSGVDASLETHAIGFAAEQSRLEGRVVDVAEVLARAWGDEP